MTEENLMLNNPLHGLKLDTLLQELVDYYGWEILAEYTRIKCFEKNVSMASSLKFLRKTEWAREKMERFYLYNYKNLPKADDANYELPPRQRIIPAHQKPREPRELVLGEAPAPKQRSSSQRGKNNDYSKHSTKAHKSRTTNKPKDEVLGPDGKVDPWANCR